MLRGKIAIDIDDVLAASTEALRLVVNKLDLRKTSQKSGLSREDDMKLLSDRGEPIGSSKEETASYHLSGSSEIVGILRKSSKRLNVDLSPDAYKVPGEYWRYYEEVWHKNGLSERITLKELNSQMVSDQSHITPHEYAVETLTELAKTYQLLVVTARDDGWQKATHVWLDTFFPDMFSKILFAGGHSGLQIKSKGQICAEHKALWLIDDNIDHCKSALDNGVKAVLFGSYGWHGDIPKEVIQCENWLDVQEYFNGTS